MRQTIQRLIFAVLLVAATSFGLLAEETSPIADIATEDVIAVGFVKLAEVDLAGLAQWATDAGVLDGAPAEQAEMGVQVGHEFIRQLTDAGADRILCLVRQADIENSSLPVFALSLSKDGEAEKLERRVKMFASMSGSMQLTTMTKGRYVFVGEERAIDSFAKTDTSQRKDLEDAWNKSDTTEAGMIVVGDADSRRVARELLPSLDPPYEKLTGELVADRLDFAALSLSLKKDIAGKVVVETKDPQAAAIIAEAYNSFVATLDDGTLANGMEAKTLKPFLADIKPAVDGPKVTFDLNGLFGNPRNLLNAILPVRTAARRTQMMNNLRQVALASLNYESANRKFPASSYDADGKPLLSWRVHILPFMEQNNLYQQFKLDEPWDSPHNIELAKVIPATYVSQLREDAAAQAEGKTRVQVVMTEGCGFGREGRKIASITDGTSNTIMVMLAPTKSAVVWTKPDDLKIDLDDPEKALGDLKKPLIFAFFDGSVYKFDGLTKEKLKAFLTVAGGELVDFP